MDAAEIEAIAARHPAAFRPPVWKRLAAPMAIVLCGLYTVYCWWFFSVGAVISNANWNLAGAYLADWVSYEIRPEIEFAGNHLVISYSRYSELGPNPNPDWVEKEMAVIDRRVERAPDARTQSSTASSAGSFMAPGAATGTSTQSSSDSFMAPGAPVGSGDTVEPPSAEPETVREEAVVAATVVFADAEMLIRPDRVSVRRGDETVVFEVEQKQSVRAQAALPDWIEQRSDGSTAYVTFGIYGRAEIQNDEVVVWKRFPGWANFVFDTNSPFWGKSFGDVVALILSGDRIDPERSNAALAWDNIVYNAEWQHGDVWLKLLQTIVMAFAGTVLASALAFPFAFLAARNITPNRLLNQGLKRAFDFLRSVDMLIWALFFTRAFGPGPLAGISAIFFTDTGTFGKLYSEALENIDDRQREGVRSVGAAPLLVQRFGVLPQVLPVFLSQSLYFWESNTRSATIIGAVGAGGIGLKLWEAMRTNQDWENVAYMVILILIVVFVFDTISNALRQRLIGGAARAG